MELIDKATILADVWLNTSGEAWDEFRAANDLGLPYAFGIVYGHILAMSEEGESMIEFTWSSLCYRIGVDDTADYLDFEHMALTAEQNAGRNE